jgi:amino acid adenylation domain-containing protein
LSRHATIIEDCGIGHLVTDANRPKRLRQLGEQVPELRHLYGTEGAEPDRFGVTSWRGVLDHDPLDSSVAMPGPDDAAYIIFTSGSTGVPKGIVHTHRSAVAYATMAADLYDLRADDRLSNFPPLHFDQSTFDFFSGPAVGATTVMIGEQHQRIPASLSSLIEAERLSIWYSVPFALVQLLLYGVLDQRDLSSLRWVIYGGEPFPIKHLRALMNRWPHARFSNCYGPAETNQCTYHHLDTDLADGLDDDASIPIGEMCPGMSGLVVDDDDVEVAEGETGELLVHSPTTMSGYWNRPEVNARVLVDRDDADGANRRYYRTGDLVRRNADGLLDFLGRRDRQIKIRGYRVELDEIEGALVSHQSVEEAAVIVTGPGSGEGSGGQSEAVAQIIAYISMASGTGHQDGEAAIMSSLRRHLASALPKYAVPNEVMVVENFPRTTSGKIDHRALEASSDNAATRGGQ